METFLNGKVTLSQDNEKLMKGLVMLFTQEKLNPDLYQVDETD